MSANTGISSYGTQVHSYLGVLKVALLKNLGHALILVGCTKLILQRRLARFIISILGAMPEDWVLAIALIEDSLTKECNGALLDCTYLWVIKILKPLTTCARGIERSPFHFFTDSISSM